MLSCLLPVEDVAGRRVTTLESITPAEGLHPVQRAFLDANALQCGYCTPGMVMVSTALLDHQPSPTDDDVRMYSALQGRSACQTEVFLGWFYKAAELADLVAGVKKVKSEDRR